MTWKLIAICCGALACLPLGIQAQTNTPPAGPLMAQPVNGERLSDWLLRQTPHALHYAPATAWMVPQELEPQSLVKQSLLEELALLKAAKVSISASFISAVESMPVTGRVKLDQSDPRWLQAHPKKDPILAADHAVSVPLRPSTVSVIYPNGTRCTMAHQSGSQTKNYLSACDLKNWHLIDQAWVIQADGDVQRFEVASWNETAQAEPAPGALIWAPYRDSGWSEAATHLLTRFLSTQNYDQTLFAFETASPNWGIQVTPGLPARDPMLSANNWGVIGLLETPSARMAEPGEARFNYNRIYPYDRSNVFLQPFEWLEAGFRYTNILNRLYGPAELSGDQTYKDKSIDLKVRLWPESAYLPQLAVGFVDLGGTGLFSSEYLVASKRHGDFDLSAGMAWGYLGSSGNITNPLTKLSPKFNTRGAYVSTGGTPNTAAYFRGPTALFGGLQYHTPCDKWVVKVEYDGNDYQHEPQANNRVQQTPFNLGLTYQLYPSTQLSMGVERGNAVVFGLTLHTSVAQMAAPKVSDPPAPKINAQPMYKKLDIPLEWTTTAADVRDMSGWGVQRIYRQNTTLRILLEGTSGAHWNDRIERIIAVLNRDAPTEIDSFELSIVEQGLGLSERIINRREWVTQQSQFLPPSQRTDPLLAQPPLQSTDSSYELIWEQTPSMFGYAVVPSWQQNIGGPDGFLLFSAGVAFPMQLRLTENLFISGALSLHLLDNYDNFKYTGPSNLPRVRTYLREYMTASDVNIPNLQITHFGQIHDNHYYSLYAGYLETSYGGLGAEWLYRPWHSPLAFGIDVNRVQQRDFDQLFGFNHVAEQTGYRVTTGHATAYWDTGWQSTHLRLNVGRYLAGDIGATIDFSKYFDNGVSVGAWVTKTNVSAEKFGEGSFDKGMYLRIPFDVMTTTRSGSVANLVYQPLTRDGGARLNRSFSLISATSARSERDTAFTPAKPFGLGP
jgi:hypothetical protein